MEIKVCVGSACYVKGSHDVIQRFQSLINEHGLHSQIELKAAFCLGKCTQAVSVQVDEDVFGIDKNEVDDFFKNEVCRRLAECN